MKQSMRHLGYLRSILSACGLVLLLAAPAWPLVLTVSWDECPGAKGYLLYWGKESGQYLQHQVVPASPCRFRLCGLEANTTYYVAMKSTSTDGTDSEFSEEVSATTLADSDGDGLSDEWEIRYGLNPEEPADATMDADSDGFNNLAEYNQGSDPLDPVSIPQTPASQAASDGGGGGCFVATAAYGSPLASEVGVLKELRDRWLLRCGPGRAFVRHYYEKGPAAAAFISGRESARWLVRGALTPVVTLCGLATTMLGQVMLAAGAAALGFGLLRRRRGGS